MKFSFLGLFFIQSVIICLGFLFLQPQTYKKIILRAVKGDTSCTSVEQSLFMQIVIGNNLPQFISLVKKLLCLCIIGFCNQGASRSSSCDKLKNFATNNLLQLVIKVAYWNLRNQLVMQWESCIKRRDCHYRSSPIGYQGKGLTIGWYKVLRFFYL